jgi:hypothetical protein
MVYDSVRGRLVLFGGYGVDALNDTWELDGMTWTEVTTTARPSVRYLVTSAFDADRDRVVMFGGYGGGAESWELTNTSWSLATPVSSPPASYGGVAAYHSAAGRTVVFGGCCGSGVGDTWTFGHTQLAVTEACASGLDYDGDGLVGCMDDDCWSVCSPMCPPNAQSSSCPATLECGDGICTQIEDCRSCPGDCPVGATSCPISCGDYFCDPPETASSCPGDCG